MVDELDKKILNVLTDNGKLSYRKVARRLGVSPATVMNRLNTIEKNGLLKKYSIILDYEKLGYDFSVIIDVKVSKGRLMDVEKKISMHPNVQAVFDVTGSFDSMILASFKKREELDHFLKKIQTYDFVERTETRLILNKMKEENIKVA